MISDNQQIWRSRVLTRFLSWLVGWPCLVVAEREQESEVRGRDIGVGAALQCWLASHAGLVPGDPTSAALSLAAVSEDWR